MKVLLVAKEVVPRRLAEYRLREHWVTIVASGADAIERLHRCPFDAIVADQAIGVPSGCEVLAAAKVLLPPAAKTVLMITAPDLALEAAAERLGIDQVCVPTNLKQALENAEINTRELIQG